MPDRISHGERLQVVFLIDVNATSISEGISCDEASKSISLCVLRVLSYFNEHRIQNSSSLVWGFKFYSSNSLTHRYERHNFKEFCVSEFEIFEKSLDSRFKETWRTVEQQQDAPQLATSSKLLPTKCLTCALTNLIHDFQWESNDINSPLRTTRRSTRSRKRNLVFLVTSCPRSCQSLDEFLGKSVQNVEEFQNVIMSQALFREFVDIYGINLYWVDTNYSNNAVDNEALLIINKFLQMLQGTVIPMQALVHMDGYHNSKPQDIAIPCGPIVPVMSVINHYVKFAKKIDTIAYEPSMKAFSLPEIDTKNCASSNWIGWLCSPGVQPRVHCTLQLRPMFSTISHSEVTSSTTENSSLTLSQKNKRHEIHMSVSHNPASSDNEVHTNKCPNLFWIKGVIRRDRVCPSWLHINKVYSCVAMVIEGQEQSNNEPALSGWYQRLMLCLSKQNLLLVIEMKEPLCNTPVTSVLQPLTSICGIISIINTDRLAAIEKLLLWKQGQQSELGIQKLEKGSDVRDFEMPGKDEKSSRVPSQFEIHSSLCMAQSSDTHEESSRSFSLQDLNTWSLGLACLQQGPPIVEPESKEESGEANNESSLIRKLQELYSKKKTKQSLSRVKTPQKLKHISRQSSKKKQKKHTNQADKVDSLSQPKFTAAETYHDNVSNSADAAKDVKMEHDKLQAVLDNLELKDEADLVTFLKDAYCQAVSQMGGVMDFIDKTIAVIEWYDKKDNQQTSKGSLEQVLTHHLLLDNLTIRDKHEGSSDSKENKLTEYQIQVLLRLEVASSKTDPQANTTTLVDEVVVMLRSMSFVKDPGFLRDFLREVILPRYVDQVPNFLCEIYEGLMQDLPPELLSPSKQNEEESPLKRSHVTCTSVVRPESDQPRSELSSRPLTRHRSIADMGGKRREIVVPGKAKEKIKKKHNKKTGPSSAQRKRSHQHKPNVHKTPVKKVRRNLFTEGSEGNEAGEGQKKVKLKVPSIFAKEERLPKHKQSKRRHSVAASKVILETPCRKQLHNALWHKQHRARKRASTVPEELNVIKESPMKDIIEGENLPRRSPRRHPGSVFQRSKSFYGQNRQSCPLVRTRSFTSTIQYESPLKLDVKDQACTIQYESPLKFDVKDQACTIQYESPLKLDVKDQACTIQYESPLKLDLPDQVRTRSFISTIQYESPLKLDFKDQACTIQYESPLKLDVKDQASTIQYESPLKLDLNDQVRTRSFTSTIQYESPLKFDLNDQGETSGTESDNNATTTTTSLPPAKSAKSIVKKSPFRFIPRKRNRFSLHTLLTTIEASNSSRSKTSKDSKKEEIAARSASRLLTKRSFSCIGFSNSSQLEYLKPSGNDSNSKDDTKTFALTKSLSLTPTRSSPRLRKLDNNLCESSKMSLNGTNTSSACSTISLNSSTNVQPSPKKSGSKTFTPTKNLSLATTRSSPRLRKSEQGVSELSETFSNSSNQVEPGFKKRSLQSPTSSSPRLPKTECESSRISLSPPSQVPIQKRLMQMPNKLSPTSKKAGSDVSESSGILKSPSHTHSSPRKKLLQTPTRSSPRFKMGCNVSDSTRISLSSPPHVFPSPKKPLPTKSSARLGKIGSSSSQLSSSPSRVHPSPTFKKQIVKSPLFSVSFGKEEFTDFNYSDEVEKIIEGLSSLENGTEGGFSKGNPQHQSQRLQNTEDDEEREVIFKEVADMEKSHQSHVQKSPVISEAKRKRERLQLSRTKKRRHKSAQRVCEVAQGNMVEIHPSHHNKEGQIEEQFSYELEDEQNKDDRVFRSNQGKPLTTRSVDSILNNIPHGSPTSSSATRSTKVVRSKSDFSGSEESCSSSRKRLSFSPVKTAAQKCAIRGALNEEDQGVDLVDDKEIKSEKTNNSQVCSEEEKQQGHVEAASSLESHHSVKGANTTGAEPTKSCISPRTLRLSTRQHGSHVVGTQRLLTSKQTVCTPPTKRKKAHAQSQNQNKRSSPLNQILKQRKRNRPEAFKSPSTKRTKVEHCTPIETVTESQEPAVFPLKVGEPTSFQFELDDCSRSSEDMMFKWFSSIAEKQSSEAKGPENLMEKEAVRNGEEGSDEDDVFQGPAFSLRSTPLSAKSIQILQESPILLQNPNISLPPGSITKRWSDTSPREKTHKRRERLKRRKCPEALSKISSNDDEDIDEYAKSISSRQSKRLKLGSS